MDYSTDVLVYTVLSLVWPYDSMHCGSRTQNECGKGFWEISAWSLKILCQKCPHNGAHSYHCCSEWVSMWCNWSIETWMFAVCLLLFTFIHFTRCFGPNLKPQDYKKIWKTFAQTCHTFPSPNRIQTNDATAASITANIDPLDGFTYCLLSLQKCYHYIWKGSQLYQAVRLK